MELSDSSNKFVAKLNMKDIRFFYSPCPVCVKKTEPFQIQMSNNVCGSLIRSIHDRAVKLVQQLADHLNSFYNRLMYSA